MVLTMLKVVGGLYLLWLAYKSARSAFTSDVQAQQAVAGERRWLWRGLVLNLSNPKAVLAWMAALSMGLGNNNGAAELVTATVMCMVIAFGCNGFYAIVFSHHSAMGVYRRSRRWIDGVVAGLFAAAGLGLLRSAVTR